MAGIHFVEDDERDIAELIRFHPIDEAMGLAVGGFYEAIGAIEAEILAPARTCAPELARARRRD